MNSKPIFSSTIAKILKKLNLLKYFNLYCSINISGTKFKIPIINQLGYHLLNQSLREPWLDLIIKSAVQSKEGVFIDVGVNIGQTLLKFKSVNFNGEYIGFEPNSICAAYVKTLVKVNNFSHCQIIPVGLANNSAVLSLFMNSNEDPSASITQDFRDESFYSDSTYIPVFNGDDLINCLEIQAISVIKIDVEGAELEVIQGLQNSIRKYQPYILCEILPVYDVTTPKGIFRKKRQDLLEQIINQENYKIYRILDDGQLLYLESIEIHSNLSFCEYILIPEQKITNFLDEYHNNYKTNMIPHQLKSSQLLAR